MSFRRFKFENNEMIKDMKTLANALVCFQINSLVSAHSTDKNIHSFILLCVYINLKIYTFEMLCICHCETKVYWFNQ